MSVSPSRFESHICDCFNFKINIKNSVKCLQEINLLRLTLAEKTEIKNVVCLTPDLVISQSSLNNTNVHEKM
jgi:hypothetical protein